MPTNRFGDHSSSGHLSRILDDKTPQLGGMLDGNGFTFNGAVAFEAQAGEALSKGNAVYVSGVSGNKPVVMKADADDAAKMPAFGIAETDANLHANVNVVTFGTVYEIDTSAYAAGDELYVSTTAGELTATKPTGATAKLQNIGKVIRSHASAGSIKVGGAGRTNAVPNLDDGTVFIGDSNDQAEQRALVLADISDYATPTLDTVTTAGNTTTNDITVGNLTSTGIDDNATSTAITIDASENVGINDTAPDAKLTIKDAATASTDPTDPTHATLSLQYTSTKVLNIGDYSATPFASYIQSTNTGGSGFALALNPSGGNVGINTASPTTALDVNGTVTSPTIRLTDQTDVSLSSTGHAFQIGPTSGTNIAADGNEIAARNNGAASTLYLNQDGGAVYINGVPVTSTLIGQWNTAYSWGDHSSAGYATSFNSLSAKDGGTGTYRTSGYLQSGTSGSGMVSLTTNDGGGNANVTFNHAGNAPDNAGYNTGRITVNVDSTSGAYMGLSVGSGGVAPNNGLTITESGISTTGTVTASGGNSSNWNTAYGWGNHASAGYAAQVGGPFYNYLSTSTAAVGITNPNVRFGRSSSQYMTFHGYAGGNVLTSVSAASNPKSNMYFGVSQDGGLTSSATWTLGGSTGSLWHTGNDGSGSGLDADTVDGLQASQFLRSDAADTTTGNITIASGSGSSIILDNSSSSTYDVTLRTAYDYDGWFRVVDGAGTTWFSVGRNAQAYIGGVGSGYTGLIWHSANDGSGSGLDADTVDGVDSSRITFGDNSTGTIATSPTGTLKSGFYNNLTTGVPTATWYSVFHCRHSNTANNFGHQIAGSFYSTGDIYNRNINNNTFGAWTKIWNTANDGSGSGLDADTVDGIQGASLMRTDVDDTFVGKLIVNDTNQRRAGMYGIYDSYRIGHIWSMGSAYQIPENGSSFGNLYGAAYTYHNRVYTSNTMGGYHQMVWCENGTPRCALGRNVWTSGNVTAYSDARVKTNIEVIPDALDKVKQLSGYTFDRTDIDTPRQTGVIAQEVLEVLPEAVTGDEDSHYNVSYGNMVGLLIEAIKEQQKQIEELKEIIKCQ